MLNVGGRGKRLLVVVEGERLVDGDEGGRLLVVVEGGLLVDGDGGGRLVASGRRNAAQRTMGPGCGVQ